MRSQTLGTLEIERDDGGGQNGQQVVVRDSRFAIAGMGPWELETGAGREGAAGVPDGRRKKNPDLGKCGWRVGGKRGREVRLGAFWVELVICQTAMLTQPLSPLPPNREVLERD